MTTLVVEELTSTLSQEFTLDLNKRYQIAGVRPLIYMHNAPSGTFTLSLKSGANTLASKDFTSTEIKSDLSTSNNYAWLWKGLVFDVDCALGKGTYTLELSSSGYSYSSSSWLGWVKEHENIFNTVSYTPDDYRFNPFSYQLFERRKPEAFI